MNMKIPPHVTKRIVIVGLMGLTLSLMGQERDRAKIPDKYKWNLADIYPNEQAWRSAKAQLAKELPQMKTFQGKLGSSAATLADALDKYFGFDKELSRLYVYAQVLSDQDTRDATHLGMKQEMTQLAAAEAAEVAFLEPEILRFEKGKVEKFIASEPRLKSYRFYLQDIARRSAHTLSAAEEKLIADMGPLGGAPSATYGIPSNADFPLPTVTLSDGKAANLDHARSLD